MILALLASWARAAIPMVDAQSILQIEAQRLPPLALSTYVTSADAELRARAAIALGRLRSAGAVAPLVDLLDDPVGVVRLEAAFALGQTPESERALLTRLPLEPDPTVRAALLEALGKVGTAAAIPFLVASLDEDPIFLRSAAVPEAAAIGLGRLGQRKAAPVDDPKIATALLDQLTRMDVRAARGAAFALFRMKLTAPDEASRERWLAAALDHRDAVVRDDLIRGLASWKQGLDDAGRMRVLEAAIADASSGVRVAAAKTGGEIGWEGVADMLTDPSHAVRIQAIQSVGSLATLDRKVLLRPILDSDAPDAEKAEVIDALAKADLLDDPAKWMSAERSALVRAAAVAAFDDRSALVELCKSDDAPPVRTAAALRLTALDPTRETLIELLGAEDPVVAAVASDHLREHPMGAAEPALLKVTETSQDPDLLTEATKALTALYKTKSAKPSDKARGIAQRLAGHPLASVRDAAGDLLAALKLPKISTSDPHVLMSTDLGDTLRIRSARIHTSRGDVVIDLYPDDAPITVASFAHLADGGFYDGRTIHRMVPDFVVQDGCPRGDGWGGPGYAIPDEINRHHYDEGMVGMALSGPDTGGSQWFVTLSPQPHLDGTYTIFGRVSQGMQVVRSLQRGDVIESIEVERVAPLGIPPLTRPDPTSSAERKSE